MQENDDIHPDYRLLMQALGEVGVAFKRVWDDIVRVFGDAANTLIDVFSNIRIVDAKPRRFRLRLKRHKTQYEKRIAWKAVHMQLIHAKGAKIYLRRIGIV